MAAQFPIEAGVPAGESRYCGVIGDELTLEQGYDAARLAAVNALARLRAALDAVAGGGFDRLIGLNHLAGSLLTTPDFIAHPRVMDGASDLFNAVLDERGSHTRSLIGAATHPARLSVQLVLSATVRPGR